MSSSPATGSSSSKSHLNPKSKRSTPSGSSSRSRLTAIEQDRQARNKDPRTGRAVDEDDDDGGPTIKKPARVSSAEDAYESAERRRWAATILDSPELLMMHAESRGDSIPGTRLHFNKILCGYEDDVVKQQRSRDQTENRSSYGETMDARTYGT